MTETTLHVSGFLKEGDRFGPSLKVSIEEGPVHKVAQAIWARLHNEGYPIKVSTTRSISGGFPVEVQLRVEAYGSEMYHLFTSPSNDHWSRADEVLCAKHKGPADEEGRILFCSRLQNHDGRHHYGKTLKTRL